MNNAFTRPAAAAAAAVVVLSWLLGLAQPAAAHDGLLSATPADGARLDQAPAAVTLRFAARLDPRLAKVAVTDPAGASVASGAFTASGAELTQPVAIAAPGRYTVAFRVVSRDGHPVSGTSTFTVTAAAASPGASPTAVTAQPAAAGPATASAVSAPHAERAAPGGPSRAVAGAVAAGVVVVGAAVVVTRRRRRAPR
ncbi:copper resistance CopC family protein [Catellatospora methionotrophica]|uniref:copper resistance CopC family protein n=1 Tax=Catellatospora methionotrophica TaxID=121620 RepID=UPI0033F9CEA1